MIGNMIAVGGTKGGSGKSTSTINLAVMRALSGRRVCIVDTDKQRSSFDWGQSRIARELNPKIDVDSRFIKARDTKDLVSAGKALRQTLIDKMNDYDDVLIDVGGEDNPALRFVMMTVSRMFVPICPAAFDMWALSNLEEVYQNVIAQNEDLRMVIFGSNVSPQTAEKKHLKDLQAEYSQFAWAPSVIYHRAQYRHTLFDGKGIFDLERPDPKAKSELLGLYRTVFQEDWMKQRESVDAAD